MTAPYAGVKPPEAEFGRHLREMARHWVLILAVTALAGIAMYVWSSSAELRYESTAVLRVQLPDDLFDDDAVIGAGKVEVVIASVHRGGIEDRGREREFGQ